jgi:hypothetical protein
VRRTASLLLTEGPAIRGVAIGDGEGGDAGPFRHNLFWRFRWKSCQGAAPDPAGAAYDHVAGYMIGNDVTTRDLAFKDMARTRCSPS